MSIFYKDLNDKIYEFLNKYRNEYFEKDFLYDIYIAIRVLREKNIGNYLNFPMYSIFDYKIIQEYLYELDEKGFKDSYHIIGDIKLTNNYNNYQIEFSFKCKLKEALKEQKLFNQKKNM